MDLQAGAVAFPPVPRNTASLCEGDAHPLASWLAGSLPVGGSVSAARLFRLLMKEFLLPPANPVVPVSLSSSAPVAAPSAWVCRFAATLPARSAVLDLACGRGRHGRWLAAQGHRVLAVDRDGEALASLADVAGLTTLQADLEGGDWPLAGRQFGGIVVTHYLHRPLLPYLAECLLPGGLLIYETFMAGNERFGKPSRPDFLLQPGELLDFARQQGLQVLAYEAGEVARPKPAMMQRLAAFKAPPDGLASWPLAEGLPVSI